MVVEGVTGVAAVVAGVQQQQQQQRRLEVLVGEGDMVAGRQQHSFQLAILSALC